MLSAVNDSEKKLIQPYLLAKKNPRFDGVSDLASMPQVEIDALLAGIEVKRIRDVGRRGGAFASSRTQDSDGCVRCAFNLAALTLWQVMERAENELRVISCLDPGEITHPQAVLGKNGVNAGSGTLPQ